MKATSTALPPTELLLGNTVQEMGVSTRVEWGPAHQPPRPPLPKLAQHHGREKKDLEKQG